MQGEINPGTERKVVVSEQQIFLAWESVALSSVALSSVVMPKG
jgi:hypothetical protein